MTVLIFALGLSQCTTGKKSGVVDVQIRLLRAMPYTWGPKRQEQDNSLY